MGRGTASRVLNDSPQVSPSARAAVLAAVAELGYVPNRAARSLVTRRTDTVVLVVSEPEERVFGEPYFAGIVRGIGERLTEAGLQLVLTMAGAAGGRERAAAYLTEQHVDGVLLLSLHAEDPLPALLEGRGVPTVCGGSPATGRPDYVVDIDNLAGGRSAVDHLVSTGRRRLAVLAGPQDMSSGRDRLVGALDAAEAAGLDRAEVAVAVGDYSEESGRRAMAEVLAAGPPPDGVFAASDLMAVGALRVLREAGLDVPTDVGLVGFDDAPVCRHTDPELTSVRQPVARMGRVMVEVLLGRIAGREVPPDTVLQTRLVVRGSTAR
ncbi:LacI family DNA-binding transcriptional regulator [Arthrobacter sp. NEB 688]|uniref:LacI family DNA-binding transcriptional regulator n=1 Tax=Arthrobacter sp. NEB 688 TaxID=904039 RepID=UPI001C201A74|nr:LacI family DNA-binding transcriptional regulator [Arthrobacter sp. NEB 688]